MVSTNAKNVVSHKDELKKAYLYIFDEFATDPTAFAAATSGVNQRFARELFATLVDQQLVVETTEEGETAWEVTDPGNQHDVSREEAESRFDEVIGGGKTSATSPSKKPPKAKELKDCMCGCGEQTQSLFKPGHDARHAGNIGRAAAEYPVGSSTAVDLIGSLPSAALQQKALGIAAGAREKVAKKAANAAAKEAAKAAKAEAGSVDPGDDGTEQVEEGTVTVGKEEYAARRFTADNTVEYLKAGDWTKASKTASKTFKQG